MKGMSGRRCAAIWTQRREVVVVLARSLSGSAAPEELSLTELAEKPPSASTASEPLFGIAPRKLRNVEDEDFVSTSPSPSPSALAAAHHNYISQTWAEQKHLTPSDEQSHPLVSSSLRQRFPTTQRSPPNRDWLVAPDLQASTPETFTLASFKVLASQVAHKHQTHLFKHVPIWMLNWSNRSKKIFAGLELCSADIICLQEVDRFSDLQSELSGKGYAGLFKASSGKEHYGCAIFWRQERFQLLHEESLEFNLLGMRDNVAQLCVLQSNVTGTPNMGATSKSGILSLSPNKRLIVGNIDVLFNPKRGHIKLGQCRAFLQQAHKLSILWPGAPLIIGGCFHLTPQSAMYNYLVNSRLDVYGLESQYLSGQVRKPVKHMGAINMTSSGKGEPSLDLRNRLRKSLAAKFASTQETHALDFSNSAKEVLSSTSSIGSCSTVVSNNGHVYKNEHTSTKNFVAKTIEILESCIKSQPSSSCMANKLTGVDAAPKAMDTGTLSANASTSPELLNHLGSKMELSSKSCNGSPDHKSLYGVDGVSTEPCSVSSSTCEEVLCGIAAPVSANINQQPSADRKEARDHKSLYGADGVSTDACTVSSRTCEEVLCGIAAPVSANIDQHPSADPPRPSTPDHGWVPEELKLATGFADSTVVKHELKLFSVYPEIKGNSKTRDDKGEPQATMCHGAYRGTVDYIWRSKGLKTAKVLDTFSLTDMVATPALPFMACGSDHIYLACELAFTAH